MDRDRNFIFSRFRLEMSSLTYVFEGLKIKTQKRLSQKIPNSPLVANPNEYGELVDKSLELQYEQDRLITLKSRKNYYFITFLVIYHFRTHVSTCLLLTVHVTLHVFFKCFYLTYKYMHKNTISSFLDREVFSNWY